MGSCGTVPVRMDAGRQEELSEDDSSGTRSENREVKMGSGCGPRRCGPFLFCGEDLLAPGAEARKPAGDVAAVGFVVGAEDFAEVRLFVETHEEGYEQDGNAGHDKRGRIGAAKDDPEADPAGEEADVHWIADVAVKADDYQALRGSDGSGRAATGPAEIPDAAEGDSETEDGGNGGEPAPARGIEGGGAEAEPNGEKPEPEGEEGGTDNE